MTNSTSNRIRASIINHTNNTKTNVHLPNDVPISRLIPALVQNLGLPAARQGGGTQQYYLTTDGVGGEAQRLSEQQTLSDAGIAEGAVLHILPEMTAGKETR